MRTSVLAGLWVFAGRKKEYEGDASPLQSSLPFLQALLKGLKSPLLILAVSQEWPFLAAPHS